MQLVEQFRVRGSDENQHTIACYRVEALRLAAGSLESSLAQYTWRLNGSESVECIDDDTYMTAAGNVLRRIR